MRSPLAQNDILQAIVRDVLATEDAPVTDVTVGTCLAAVSARYCGLASLVSHIAPGLARLQPARDALPQSARNWPPPWMECWRPPILSPITSTKTLLGMAGGYSSIGPARRSGTRPVT